MLAGIITVLLIIILSPVILVAGFIALVIAIGLIAIPITVIGSLIIRVWDFISKIIKKAKKRLEHKA